MNIKPIFFVFLLAILIAIVIYSKNKKENSNPLDNMPLPSPANPITPDIPKVPEHSGKIAPKKVNTYAEAITSSKESNCNIFLFFGAPWCGFCEQMKSTTLANSEVDNKLKTKFVVLIIDTDEDKSVAEKFGVRSIPAYMIINHEGGVLKKTTGYKAKTEFLKWLND